MDAAPAGTVLSMMISLPRCRAVQFVMKVNWTRLTRPASSVRATVDDAPREVRHFWAFRLPAAPLGFHGRLAVVRNDL